MADTPERMRFAVARLEVALNAAETPFQLATVVTGCWRYAIGDDDGAVYGLTDHGLELWQLIQRVVEFERSKASPNEHRRAYLIDAVLCERARCAAIIREHGTGHADRTEFLAREIERG